MKMQELAAALKGRGFEEDKLDSGCNYTKKSGHIELICYLEPEVDVEFVIYYRWSNNDVKGTYNVPLTELNFGHESIISYFRKAKDSMPLYIGNTVDVHEEVENVIERTFGPRPSVTIIDVIESK